MAGIIQEPTPLRRKGSYSQTTQTTHTGPIQARTRKDQGLPDPAEIIHAIQQRIIPRRPREDTIRLIIHARQSCQMDEPLSQRLLGE